VYALVPYNAPWIICAKKFAKLSKCAKSEEWREQQGKFMQCPDIIVLLLFYIFVVAFENYSLTSYA
jgi:hypothetical protein